MEYRLLGGNGVQVSKLALGSMMFGSWGNPDHDASIDVIHRALDAGVNLIDTADVYSAGESEEIVGKAIAGRRDEVVLATKFWGTMGDGANQRGASRRWIIQAVENSLRRLGTDWIDLYQMHNPNVGSDIEETLGALTDLVRQGKIRYIGASKLSPSRIVETQWVSRDRHLERFVTEQPTYSILARGIETEVLPTAAHYRIGVITYSPLNGGWLSGAWTRDGGAPEQAPARRRLTARFDMALPANQAKLDAVEKLGALAAETGITLIELAIAFAINHPTVTAALIGPRTREHLESQLSAADVVLGDAVLDRIDEIVRPGVTLNPADVMSPPDDPSARRRYVKS